MASAWERLNIKDLLAEGDPNFTDSNITDEWQAMALNYTSGTTGNPKGVVYSHRGAYLNAIGHTLVWPLGEQPVYLMDIANVSLQRLVFPLDHRGCRWRAGVLALC